MAQAVPTVPAPGQITGTVFDDRNGNGTKESGEPGIANVTVTRVGGSAVTTAGDGTYTFNNVPPGDQTINITVPAGYVAAGTTSRTVNVVSGGTAQANFTLSAQGVIQGVVFEDINGNGSKDAAEPGISGVTINRSTGPAGTTDANGAYRFTNVNPGTYEVSVVLPAGYVAGGPTTRSVNVSSGGAGYASFALLAQGVVQGVIYEDRNGNGAQDSNESGVAGVSVALGNGPTTTTDAGGTYRFSNVNPGTYEVRMTVPTGYVAKGVTVETINIVSGGSNQANFALQAQGVIQGIVFDDLNGNGKQDDGESGLQGITIGRTPGSTTTTDADGAYRFTNVNPGGYTIKMTVPSGYVAGGANEYQVNIVSGGAVQANFTLLAQGVIQGVVFDDRNGNGTQETTEPGIGGVTIARSGGASTTTTTNGSYRFANVTPGNHTLVMTVPAGYFAAGAIERQVNVASGGAAQANFRLLVKGSIQGVVYQDLNLNGIQDSGEPGVAGVTVSRGAGTSTTTDAGGSYRFSDVVPGSYLISIVLPNGYFSQQGTTRTTIVSSGGASHKNFALFVQGVIQGVVYEDSNSSGIQDGNERGIGGVTITRSDGATQVTSSNGFYRFTNVTPGSYSLEMTVPSSFVAAGASTRQVNVGNGASAQANFTLLAKGTIQGFVFDDRNGNGRQDIGEAGVGGVTVTRGTGPATTTDSNGGYSFTSVVPGSYSLILLVPTGYVTRGAIEYLVNIGSGGSARANFALQAQGVIQGVVFDDLNGNGEQDTGESGVGGVSILRNAALPVVTDASGGYSYKDVTPEDYTMNMALPAGYVAGGPTSRTVTVSSGGSAQANFAILAQGVIQGIVFEDRNSNGYQDGGEPGVGSIAIQRNDGQATGTDGTGGYQYRDVTPGSYTVELLTLPEGYIADGLAKQSVNVGSGGSAQANFAVLVQGVIQGVVFEDRNGNGTQEHSEPGVGDVEVSLDGGTSQLTDIEGGFVFEEVTPGAHILTLGAETVQAAGGLSVQTVPEGYSPAGPTVRKVNVGSGSSAQANFTLYAQGVIQGVVFDDLNTNKVQDAGEQGVAGVTVTRSDGATATTDSSGTYQFADVAPGEYGLEVILPDGYIAGGPSAYNVNVTSGSSAQANFILLVKGVIQGAVFDDVNGNIVQDSGESGVAGVVVTRNDGPTTTTDSNGGYSFADVEPGTYTLDITVPDGYVATESTSVDIPLASGGAAGASFPLNAKGVIQGVAFDDLNGNGLFDADELGVGGVTVTLDGETTTTTSNSGSYRFEEIAPGGHAVEIALPTGYVFGSSPNLNVNIASGGSAQANFTLQAEGIIQGVVFNDFNGNGQQDGGEPGVGGVTVARNDDATTTTNSGGGYQFPDSPPGIHDIAVTVPNGYIIRGDALSEVDLGSGDAKQVNFGLQAAGVIQGIVFDDRNGNTYQDVGERGLGGVTVRLIRGGSATTTTDGRGNYRFSNMASGYYGIQVINPPGYSAIRSNYQSVNVGDSNIAQANFMMQMNGVLQGVVFYDRNYNGVQDYYEPGIGGIQVSGPTTTRTSSNGFYRMTNLPARSSYVYVYPPSYFTPGSLNPVLVNIPSDGAAQANFALDYRQRGVIEGIAFEDRNFNSFPDPGERGFGGLPMRLYLYDYSRYVLDPQLSAAFTARDGAFRLTQARPYQYHGIVAPQIGGYRGYSTYYVYTDSYGNSRTTVRLPYRRLNTISGYLFVDTNANNRPESSERGLGGVIVNLLDRFNAPVATTRTNSDGYYQFVNVNRTNGYQLYRVVVAGSIGTSYEFAYGNSYLVGMYSSWYTYRNFALRERNTVIGTAVPGTQLTFTSNSVQAAGDAVPQATFTVNVPASGEYSLRDLPPGDYTVTQAPPEGFYAPPEPLALSVGDGEGGAAVFEAKAANSISGAVYEDSNSNGTRDPGETGLSGVVINLRQGNTTVQTTTTTLQGTYQFDELELGVYDVVEDEPDGYTSTTPNSVAVELNTTSPVGFASYGERPERTVTGVVFRDDNFNGRQDADEEVIDAVVVSLLPESGNTAVATATTQPVTGEYRFEAVENGTYRVRVDVLPDHNVSTAITANITISDEENGATVNFGQTTNDATFYLPTVHQ